MRISKLLPLLVMLIHSGFVCAIPMAKLDVLAANSIYKVIPLDDLKFQLARADEDIPVSLVLYGKDANQFAVFDCSHHSVFGIYSQGNIMGSINLAVCPVEVISTSMVEKMEANVNAFVSRYLASKSPQELDDTGFIFKKTILSNGDEAYYFPVIAIGHGVLPIKTVVLFKNNSSQVFVLQHYPKQLCSTPIGMNENRLCEKGHGSLIEIITTFMNDFINKK